MFTLHDRDELDDIIYEIIGSCNIIGLKSIRKKCWSYYEDRIARSHVGLESGRNDLYNKVAGSINRLTKKGMIKRSRHKDGGEGYSITPGENEKPAKISSVEIKPRTVNIGVVTKSVTVTAPTLEESVLEKMKALDPIKFESFILKLFAAVGYRIIDHRINIENPNDPRDGGIDGIIALDALGFFSAPIQVKRWQVYVGRPELQKFSGALDGMQASMGVFVTTSRFSDEAIDFVSKCRNKIHLIAGKELAKLAINHNMVDI